MHSTNFHFYPNKNYLHSKPVEGLRGFGVGYGFSFNGQEKDDEVSGSGNTMTAQFWEYDARLGRRWNMDPIVKSWESGYSTFSNNPIRNIDPDGLDPVLPTPTGKAPGPWAPPLPKGTFRDLLISAKRCPSESPSVATNPVEKPSQSNNFIKTITGYFSGMGISFATNNSLVAGTARFGITSSGIFDKADDPAYMKGLYLGMVVGDGVTFLQSIPEILGGGAGALLLDGGPEIASGALLTHGILLAGVSATNIATDLLALQRLVMSKGVDNGSSDNGESGAIVEYKKPKSNISGKEGAKDVPSWAKGNKPRVDENGEKFAKRLLDVKYGKGNYSTKSNTEYSKIAKWGNRAFE